MASSRITDVRCKFVLMANRKMMTMPYIMFDRPEVGEAKRKCINATVDMVNGWIINGMNRYEKEVFYDRMMPQWREKFYYYRTSSNFEFAKDVRIFDMKDAIEEKQKKVQGKIIHVCMAYLCRAEKGDECC